MGPTYDLAALRAAANKVCQDAIVAKAEIGDTAVNWNNLSCINASWWIDDKGDSGYAVLIEEANASAFNLTQFIGNGIRHAGFENVQIRLEW